MAVSISEAFCSEMYSNSLAMIICVSSSASEPWAMYKKRLNSLGDFRAWPSAILEGIEMAARRI